MKDLPTAPGGISGFKGLAGGSRPDALLEQAVPLPGALSHRSDGLHQNREPTVA